MHVGHHLLSNNIAAEIIIAHFPHVVVYHPGTSATAKITIGNNHLQDLQDVQSGQVFVSFLDFFTILILLFCLLDKVFEIYKSIVWDF